MENSAESVVMRDLNSSRAGREVGIWDERIRAFPLAYLDACLVIERSWRIRRLCTFGMVERILDDSES